MVTVNLNTKVLPTSHRVYMVRPGSGYHLRQAFVENHAIAPDLAGLSVRDGKRPRDSKKIVAQIKRARAMAEWVRTEETRAEKIPPSKLAKWKGGENPPRLGMYRNIADEILHQLPKGTLIYVPNPNFTEDAMFGELVGAEEARVKFNGTGHRSQFTYLGRKLTNVKFLPMRKLPKAFFPPMKKRNWTFEMDTISAELLYRQYYGDFEIVGRKSITEIKVTKSRVYAPDLAIVGAVTNLVDQTIRRLEVQDAEMISLLDVVFLAPENDAPVIHANLGSSGEVLVEAVRRHSARVVKVLLVLAVVYTGHEIWHMVENNELSLGNSQAILGVGVEDLAETQQLTYDFVRSTGRDSLNEIVGIVREFHDRTGGNVDATIIVDE
ncbi:hypothetical protein Q8W37_04390 [Shimia thalassica]|uniref:hypothetical protein n=1 Tax=Shimia thalassica TaxID=1715693 RepID=UPI002734E332|nr:hypothetical protein [Shimia thalassica]MDP2579158.1 hypothetical protein [Shimia thalassica]